MEYEIACPILVLKKLEGQSDEVIVSELELVALELLVPWNKMEYDSFIAVCGHQGRTNRCLEEMGVRYKAWPVPS